MLCGHAQGRLYVRVRVSLPAQPAGRQPVCRPGRDVPGADRCCDHGWHRAHFAADAVSDCRFRRRPADAAPAAVHARDGSISRSHRRAARVRAQSAQFEIGIALHSLRAVPPDALRAVLLSLPDSKTIHIHIAEQEREVAASQQHLGARPIEWLIENARVDRRWCLVHATHSTAAELKAVAATGAVVGLCPTTEANLGDGIFPLPAWLAAGGTFAIGSDSHICVSPIEELRWLEYQARLRDQQRNVLATQSEDRAARCCGSTHAPRARVRPRATSARSNRSPRRSSSCSISTRRCSPGATTDEMIDTFVFAGTATKCAT